MNHRNQKKKQEKQGKGRTVAEAMRRPTLRSKGERALRVDEVFRAGAYDIGHTYVARPEAEQLVQEGLRHSNAIILFSGPSKSGKTVLCHRLAGALPKAHVHVFQTMTGEEFWEALRQAIEVPERVENITRRERKLESARTARRKGGIGNGFFSFELEHEDADISGEGEGAERIVEIATPGRMGVLNFLKTHPYTIIIDDYHWLNPAIAPEIFPPLKQVLGWGSRVILISVSKTAFPTKGDFGDFTGRFVNIAMPPWNTEDIRQIGLSGFPLLNLDVPEATVFTLAGCSYLSPLLMHGLCERFCYENGVQEALQYPKSLSLDGKGQSGALAGRFAEQLTQSFDEILTDSERGWRTKDGRTLSLAEVLILGISHRRPFEPFALSDLVKRLEEKVLKKPIPTTISASLVRKILEIQEKFGGAKGDRSPIYFDPTAKTVTIVDPYFKLWVRWVKGVELGGNLFPRD